MMFPKPNYKAQRNKRRNEIKRKDMEISKWASEQRCSIDGCYNQAEPHHLIPRRFLETRHDKTNIRLLCRYHHRLLHDGLISS